MPSRRSRVLLLYSVAALLGACAPQNAAVDTYAAMPANAGSNKATRIETDQNTGTIRFIVNGQEQTRIDADGMHVRQNVATSTITAGATYSDQADGDSGK